MSESSFKALHAIQLASIETRELFIRINERTDKDLIPIYKEAIEMASAHSDFNKEENTVNVGLRLSLGMEDETELPVSIRIEVIGTFTVDTDEFDEGKIEEWADKNAPFILYPFIRENGVALTTRCGLPAMILPLVQVPTLTTKDPTKSEQSKKKKKNSLKRRRITLHKT
jgi:preprotein translocase subunit SecB